MIFPDKPRPPWQWAQPRVQKPGVTVTEPAAKPRAEPRPPGYWRERIEFALICIGFYFWVNYWIQFQ